MVWDLDMWTSKDVCFCFVVFKFKFYYSAMENLIKSFEYRLDRIIQSHVSSQPTEDRVFHVDGFLGPKLLDLSEISDDAHSGFERSTVIEKLRGSRLNLFYPENVNPISNRNFVNVLLYDPSFSQCITARTNDA